MQKSIFLLLTVAITISAAAQKKTTAAKPAKSTVKTVKPTSKTIAPEAKFYNKPAAEVAGDVKKLQLSDSSKTSSADYPQMDFNGKIDNLLEQKKMVLLGNQFKIVVNTPCYNTASYKDQYALIANENSMAIIYLDSIGRRSHLKEFWFDKPAEFLVLDDDGILKAGYTYTDNDIQKVAIVWQAPGSKESTNGAGLIMDSDGNVIVQNAKGEKLWNSETCYKCKYGLGDILNQFEQK